LRTLNTSELESESPVNYNRVDYAAGKDDAPQYKLQLARIHYLSLQHGLESLQFHHLRSQSLELLSRILHIGGMISLWRCTHNKELLQRIYIE